MAAYFLRRALLALLSIWAISVLSFVIIQLPDGDVVDTKLQELAFEGTYFSQQEADALREFYGLNRPIYQQYLHWTRKLLKLELGRSWYNEVPVKRILAERLPYTILVAGATILFTWVMAIPIGIYSAVRQHKVEDYTVTFFGFVGLAVPDFLLALLLMFIALKYLHVSVGGLFSVQYLNAPWSIARFWDLMSHLWIPAVVLGTSGMASLVRIMRNNLLDELGKPYVVTARAKGLRNWRAILKYPVRIAINPLVSAIGYLLPFLIGGSVIVSVVLSLPTLGPSLLRSLLEQDMFMAGTIILILGILTVIGTLISDILLVIVDPRIRMEKAAE